MACNNATAYNVLFGRMQKPFNPLLGETFELVTPDFRLIGEAVSHHPPIVAFNVQMKNAEVTGQSDPAIQF